MSSKSRSFLASPEGVQKLQAAKAELNLSFAAIAKQAGVSADTVSRLFHPERGKRLSEASLAAIAEVLTVTTEELVTAEESENHEGFIEAQKRIQEAIENKATELTLSDLELTSIPKELGQLNKLMQLDLSDNKITSVPKEIGQLNNLIELKFSQNQLSSIPKELTQLKKLKGLFLNQNQLSSIPKELTQLSKLVVLVLDQNQLASAPKELSKLKNLESLSFSQNRLTSIPKELGQLNNLTELFLNQNRLTSVPKELSKLHKLGLLSFSQNQLTSIPREFGQLNNLTELSLDQNQLTSIPMELCQLNNLSELHLSNNRLTMIPKELGQLSNLTQLFLDQNQLTSIPMELCQLNNLSELHLSNNRLTMIPKELGQLSNLTQLFLTQNFLSHIPKEIGQLTKLKHFYLDANQIVAIPKEFGQLIHLTRIDLDQNHLTSIPQEFGQLMNVTQIYLDQNRLEFLPKELEQLTKLDRLYLHGNEKLGIATEILGPTWPEVDKEGIPAKPADILNYYFRIQADRQPLNEAKLILVGFGAVGKTSLVNRLIHNTFDPTSKKTEGINITQWPLQLNQSEDITLHVWDFGGQEIMHSTHQFFLTERSLYLLVLNGRQGHEDADAEYWLELIQSFGGDSPVIVVLNKVAEHPFDINRRALQQKFPNICEFIQTDCDIEIGIDTLRSTIERETDRLEHLRDPFPGSWFEIKRRLSDMATNYISFEKYREICQADGETEPSAQNSLAVHLHSLGIALNYKDDGRLRDTHVLNPRWVTNGIYTLLNDHDLTATNGELEIDCLNRLLDPKDYPIERHDFLLGLMRKFELCFPFQDDEKRYLIPDLLDKQQPKAASQFAPTECLNFRYEYPILPEGLLPRFIVRTHVLSDHQLRWRTGVILNFEGNQALVKADPQEKSVSISVNGPLNSRRRLLAIIRSDFERIHSNFKFIPKELVPVPDYPDITVNYKDLLIRESKGRQSFEEVVGHELLELNVQDLLNGVDIEGSRQKTSDIERHDQALKLFYSYAHKDETLRNQLETHLKILQRQKLIQPWHDRCIVAGTDWAKEIDDNIKRADIILLLISADFIASDYCYEIELKQAMKRHHAGEARVIPVILRHVDWKKTPFSVLQSFPTNAKPITSWSDRDEAWLNVETAIREAVEDIKSQRYR